MLKSPLRSLVVMTSLLAAAGCGGGPTLYPITGKVSLNGEPLADAAVIFMPADGSANSAQGVSGPDGSYSLRAAAGKYTVSVNKVASASSVPDQFKDDPSMADMAPVAPGAKKKQEKHSDAVGQQFENVEVIAGTNEPKDFDVKAAADAAKP